MLRIGPPAVVLTVMVMLNSRVSPQKYSVFSGVWVFSISTKVAWAVGMLVAMMMVRIRRVLYLNSHSPRRLLFEWKKLKR